LDTLVRQIFQILPQPNSSDYYLIGIQFNYLVNLPGSNFIERYDSNGTSALWVLNLDENGCFNGISTDTIWTKSLLISETKEGKWG